MVSIKQRTKPNSTQGSQAINPKIQMMSAHKLMHHALGVCGSVSIKIKQNGILGSWVTGMCFFLDSHHQGQDLRIIVTAFHIMECLLDKGANTVLWINGKRMEKKNIYCDQSHDLVFIVLDSCGKKESLDKKSLDKESLDKESLGPVSLSDKIFNKRTKEHFTMKHLETKIISTHTHRGTPVFVMRQNIDNRGIVFRHGYIKKCVKGKIQRMRDGFMIDIWKDTRSNHPGTDLSDLLILDIDNVEPGFSGAPVINYSGQIIGMIFGGSENDCMALGIETVFKCFSETLTKGFSGSGTMMNVPENQNPISKL